MSCGAAYDSRPAQTKSANTQKTANCSQAQSPASRMLALNTSGIATQAERDSAPTLSISAIGGGVLQRQVNPADPCQQYKGLAACMPLGRRNPSKPCVHPTSGKPGVCWFTDLAHGCTCRESPTPIKNPTRDLLPEWLAALLAAAAAAGGIAGVLAEAGEILETLEEGGQEALEAFEIAGDALLETGEVLGEGLLEAGVELEEEGGALVLELLEVL